MTWDVVVGGMLAVLVIVTGFWPGGKRVKEDDG